jgi:hypothetical protein
MPVWAPEPIVAPKLAVLPEPADGTVPPPIPNWERASVSAPWPEVPREHPNWTRRPPRLVDSVEETHQQHGRRSRALITTAVLASLFVVFVVVMVVMVLLHHSDNSPAGRASTAATVSRETARLQAATTAMNRDGTAAHSALLSLKAIPTTVQVAAVINPYASSLRHYQTVLSGAHVPTSSRGAAANVRALLSGEVRFLPTIDGLPPLRLGAYLEQFGSDLTHLQKDLGALEHALRARTS